MIGRPTCHANHGAHPYREAYLPAPGRPPGKDVPHDGHDGPPPGGSLGTSSSIMHHSTSRLFCWHPSNRNMLSRT